MTTGSPVSKAAFKDLPIGATCMVTLSRKLTRVVKTEWIKSGSRALNARKLDGRKGRTRVWSDSQVVVLSLPTNTAPRPFVLRSYNEVQ